MNVKPGDLAIVVKGRMIGKVCKVLQKFYGGEHDGILWSTGNESWICEFPRKYPLIGGESKFISMFDAHLRPVSGLPDAEQIDQQEPIKEIA